MQKLVDTLYVIAGDRGEYPLADLAAAIAWTSGGSYAIYVVDARPLSQHPAVSALRGDRIQLVDAAAATTSWPMPGIYQTLHALAAALDGGVLFKQAIILRDTTLIVGRGLDTFGLTQLKRSDAMLLGVRDARGLDAAPWQLATGWFYKRGVQHEAWSQPPVTLSDAVLFLSYAGATRLHSLNLCRVENWSEWAGNFGQYVSWLIQLLDGNVLCWGSTEKTLPPLYACESPNPPPHVLSPQFLAFGAGGSVRGYSERDLRELYKEQRGQPAEIVPNYGPVMVGRLLPRPA